MTVDRKRARDPSPPACLCGVVLCCRAGPLVTLVGTSSMADMEIDKPKEDPAEGAKKKEVKKPDGPPPRFEIKKCVDAASWRKVVVFSGAACGFGGVVTVAWRPVGGTPCVCGPGTFARTRARSAGTL